MLPVNVIVAGWSDSNCVVQSVNVPLVQYFAPDLPVPMTVLAPSE